MPGGLKRVAQLIVGVGVCILAAAGHSSAAQKPAARRATKPPLEILQTAHRFGAQAGRGWNPTVEAAAFTALFAEDDARAKFESLVESANPPARLYGLCGLYRLHAPDFSEAVARVATSKAKVDTIRGCFGGGGRLSEILAGAAEGKDSSEFMQICAKFRVPEGGKAR